MLQEKPQAKLTKEQKRAVSLLSIGTFLEYFDLLLSVNMAMVIDDLFFPSKDLRIKEMIQPFSFSSTYFLSPFGALFFGYIGDIFGRKITIVLTTITMAFCCLTLTILPTYEQIGITAPIILTIARIIQGMSVTAEVTGVEIYITESIKPPKQYQVVASVAVFVHFGSLMSIAIGYISTTFLAQEMQIYSWRLAFLFGGLVGIVGASARRTLKEASEFTDRQRLLKEQFKKAQIEWNKDNKSINPKIPFSTSLAYFFVHSGRGPCLYFIYSHCGMILKNHFKFTAS